ncbi:MAG: molybdenum cofactor guanylyltransferase MobA [Gammaproteobacteria bacterium]|nr:molybdenum cofactor guanylyltransferase MobA [Gammaproteobacteria bacterium]
MPAADTSYPAADITGVVLAGGRARRMGGEDKGLVEVEGKPMVVHALERLRPQVGAVVINANRNLDVYRRLGGCEVVADTLGDFAGPLAGMASAMAAARTRWVLTVPCDSPLLSRELGPRLWAAMSIAHAEGSVAHDGERMQPVFALLRTDLARSILEFLEGGGRKIDLWYAGRKLARGDLSDCPDTFLNVNTPEDRERLAERLRSVAAC